MQRQEHFLAPRESVTWQPRKSDRAGSPIIKSAGNFFKLPTLTIYHHCSSVFSR